jgi:hypothetical protein
MTTAEWLSSSNPNEMLYHRQIVVGPRKMRLFAAACCRRLQLLGFPLGREIVVLERAADGETTPGELAGVAACGEVKYNEGLDTNEGVIHYHVCSALEAAAVPGIASPFAAVSAAYAFAWQSTRLVLERGRVPVLHRRGEVPCRGCALCRADRVQVRPDAAADAAFRRERRQQCALLRDLLGNPFHPVRLDRRWVSQDVVAIARHAYDLGDFEALPILADALEEAGCDDCDILGHCRSGTEHVRGCWVLDGLLGKAEATGQWRAITPAAA